MQEKNLFALFLMENLYLNTAGLHHILRQLIRIRIGVNNALNASIDEDFGAHYAGLVRAIESATVNGYTVISSLHHRILLRMNTTTQLVILTGRYL